MPRVKMTLSQECLDRLDQCREKFGSTRSGFTERAVLLLCDSTDLAIVGDEPARTLPGPRPTPSAVAHDHALAVPPEAGNMRSMPRGDTLYWTVDGVCATFGIAPEQVRQGVDEDDFLDDYAGADWVPQSALRSAAVHCEDKVLAKVILAYAQEKLSRTPGLQKGGGI